MMRIGFLPSDFNPMILMLGEAEDCRALGGVLRRFARDGADVAFADLGFCQVAATDVLLTAAPGPAGVQRCEGHAFIWRVPPETWPPTSRNDWTTWRNRDASPGRRQLDCGTEDGITVKVSRGEYTDDFCVVGKKELRNPRRARTSTHPRAPARDDTSTAGTWSVPRIPQLPSVKLSQLTCRLPVFQASGAK